MADILTGAPDLKDKSADLAYQDVSPSFMCKEHSSLPERLGTVGFIGRFKPLHKGASIVLEEMCKRADHVIIGVGSSNKYNYRNPFTAEESEEMINTFLKNKYNNYSIVKIPDFAHIPEFSDGIKWKEYIKKNFGGVNYLFSGNEYVRELLKNDYTIIYPAELILYDLQIMIKATMVRYKMIINDAWEKLVPEETRDYIKSKSLDVRLRKEFGLETIARLTEEELYHDDLNKEKEHTIEV